MSWVAVAIGGSAILNYMGSQNAASAQQNAANQSNQTQWNMYNQTRNDQAPWRGVGGAAVNQLGYLMGLPGYAPQGYGQQRPLFGHGANIPQGYAPQGIPQQAGGNGVLFGKGGIQPEMSVAGSGGPLTLNDGNGGLQNDDPMANAYGGAQSYGNPMDLPMGGYGTQQGTYNTAMGGYGSLATPFSQTNWQVDPGYAFRLAEGQKALERSASAKGMTLSGAQARALTAYGQGMGSQEYGNAYNRYNNDQTTLFNRLAGLSGTGQTSSNTLANVGMNTANQVSNGMMAAGNAQSAGWTAGTGALSNGLNAFASWNNYNNGPMSGPGGYGYGYTGNMSNPYGTTGAYGDNGAWASMR